MESTPRRFRLVSEFGGQMRVAAVSLAPADITSDLRKLVVLRQRPTEDQGSSARLSLFSSKAPEASLAKGVFEEGR
ncbi:hypothetical protein C8034_v012217 [Colletotrichum sidae]|uniref:Uncharacterized protein n=1 Tax=Colletotrichum sidae TaxID=1347389 RepID=A0A4R8THZ4_9PEZI|nr:hypothetical protein C8034_v012217 [Colletotrichum sidae]